jgi:hypothetical protein
MRYLEHLISFIPNAQYSSFTIGIIATVLRNLWDQSSVPCDRLLSQSPIAYPILLAQIHQLSIEELLQTVVRSAPGSPFLACLAFRSLVPGASFRGFSFAHCASQPWDPAHKPAILSLLIGFCSTHCDPAPMLSIFVANLGSLYARAEGPEIRILVMQLGLAMHTESEVLSRRALEVVTQFQNPPMLLEAAMRYLTKFDGTHTILSFEQRRDLAVRMLAGGVPNIVIVAAVPLLREFAQQIWGDQRVREIVDTTQASSIADRALRMQLEFYAVEGKEEFTTADLVRYATKEMTMLPAIRSSGDTFEMIPLDVEGDEDGSPWGEPLDASSLEFDRVADDEQLK